MRGEIETRSFGVLGFTWTRQRQQGVLDLSFVVACSSVFEKLCQHSDDGPFGVQQRPQLRWCVSHEIRSRAPYTTDFGMTWSMEFMLSYSAERASVGVGVVPYHFTNLTERILTMSSYDCLALVIGDAVHLAGTGGYRLGPIRSREHFIQLSHRG